MRYTMLLTRNFSNPRLLNLGESELGKVPIKINFPNLNYDRLPPIVKPFVKVELPLYGELKVVEDDDGITILEVIPSSTLLVGIYEVPPGYKGYSELEIHGARSYFKYPIYKSPRGRDGVGEGVIFDYPAESKVVISYKREGRLYGADRGVVIFSKDGVSEIPHAEGHAEGMEDLILPSIGV